MAATIVTASTKLVLALAVAVLPFLFGVSIVAMVVEPATILATVIIAAMSTLPVTIFVRNGNTVRTRIRIKAGLARSSVVVVAFPTRIIDASSTIVATALIKWRASIHLNRERARVTRTNMLDYVRSMIRGSILLLEPIVPFVVEKDLPTILLNLSNQGLLVDMNPTFVRLVNLHDSHKF